MCCTGTRTNRDLPRQPGDAFSGNDLDLPAATDEEVIGLITLEDVMEELIQVTYQKMSFSNSFVKMYIQSYCLLLNYLQEEILDETDEYVDVHNR